MQISRVSLRKLRMTRCGINNTLILPAYCLSVIRVHTRLAYSKMLKSEKSFQLLQTTCNDITDQSCESLINVTLNHADIDLPGRH